MQATVPRRSVSPEQSRATTIAQQLSPNNTPRSKAREEARIRRRVFDSDSPGVAKKPRRSVSPSPAPARNPKPILKQPGTPRSEKKRVAAFSVEGHTERTFQLCSEEEEAKKAAWRAVKQNRDQNRKEKQQEKANERLYEIIPDVEKYFQLKEQEAVEFFAAYSFDAEAALEKWFPSQEADTESMDSRKLYSNQDLINMYAFLSTGVRYYRNEKGKKIQLRGLYEKKVEALFKVHYHNKPVLPKSLAGLMEFVKAYLNICHERGLDGEQYNKERIAPLMNSKFHGPVTVWMNLVHDSPFKDLGVKKLKQGMAQFLRNQARRGQAESLDEDDDASLAPPSVEAQPGPADTQLASAVASLATDAVARQQDVSRINGHISQVVSAIGSASEAIGSETTARKNDVARIDGQISQVLTAVGSETAARKNDVARIDGNIGTVKDELERLKSVVSTLQKAERPEQQQHDLSGIQHLDFEDQKPAARSTPAKKPATSTKAPASDHRNTEFWEFKPFYIIRLHRDCITCENTISGETPGRCSRHNKNLSDADRLPGQA